MREGDSILPRLVVRPLELTDIRPLVASLREADLNACRATTTTPLHKNLRLTREVGRANLITLPDGQPLAFWGLVPLKQEPGVGLISALLTRLGERHMHTLHGAARGILDEALLAFPKLVNVVWTGNELHVRWLRRIGAAFTAYYPRGGVFGEPFWRFEITRDNLTTLMRSIH